MNTTTLLLLPLALTSALAAQDPCTRTATQLPGQITTTADDRVCSPKQDLQALPIAGAVHTGQLVHAAWVFPDAASGLSTLYYRRSTNGGCDWEPEQILWQAQTGEAGVDTDFRLLCWGHEVYALFSTDRLSNGTPSGGDDHLWVVASDRQGIAGTWTQLHVSNGQEVALSTTDQGADVDEPEGAAKDGSLHVVFEYDYTFAAGTGAASINEDAFYQRVDFVAPGTLGLAFAEEVRLESTASGVIDTDRPMVACVDDLVVVGWQDDRAAAGVGNNNWNDTVIRVSTDDGATFGAEQNLTSFAAPTTFAAQRESQLCVFGQAPNYSVAVFTEDSRGGDDDCYLYLSTTSGAPGTFVPPVVVSRSPAGVDSDGMAVGCTPEGALYVSYEDDRSGANQTFVVTDANGGADFLAGLQTETLISQGNTSTPLLDCHGSYAAVTFVDNIAGADPAAVAFTYDFGATWTYCELVDPAAIDADADAVVAVTTRGDVVVTWMDDRNGGNANNNLFAGGLRVTYVEYDANLPGYVCRNAGESGDSNILLIGFTAPACGAFQIDPANGWQSNFTVDGLTLAVASLPLAYGTVDNDRDAVYFGLPSATALLGITTYASAVSQDPATFAIVATADTLTIDP
jgi:hypothetical protein